MEYGRKVLREFQIAKEKIGKDDPVLLQLKFDEKFLFESYFDDAEILAELAELPCFLENGVKTISFTESYYREFINLVTQKGFNVLVVYIDEIEI